MGSGGDRVNIMKSSSRLAEMRERFPFSRYEAEIMSEESAKGKIGFRNTVP